MSQPLDTPRVASAEPPAPARALAYRLKLLRRVEQWRGDLATLNLGIIATGPRARVALSRQLGELVASCDELQSTVEQLATATDGQTWHEARARAEQQWAELVVGTKKLRQRIKLFRRGRRRRSRSRVGRQQVDLARPSFAAGSVTVDRKAALDGASAETLNRKSLSAHPSKSLRAHGYRLWSSILDRCGNLVGSEGLHQASRRYQLRADRAGSSSEPDRRTPRQASQSSRSASPGIFPNEAVR